MNPFRMTGWTTDEYGEMVETTVIIDDFPYIEPPPQAAELPPPNSEEECPW